MYVIFSLGNACESANYPVVFFALGVWHFQFSVSKISCILAQCLSIYQLLDKYLSNEEAITYICIKI